MEFIIAGLVISFACYGVIHFITLVGQIISGIISKIKNKKNKK